MTLKQLWSIFRGRRTNYSWANASWTYYPDGDPMGKTMLTPTQKAYALLWQEISDRPRVHEARRILLAAMTKDEQRAAITWIKQNYPLTEREILEKSP
jgi:hypothetical protein